MEGLKLDVGTLVPEEVHHQLQVLGLADVARHHCEVVSVQQQLPKKLRGNKRSVGVAGCVHEGAVQHRHHWLFQSILFGAF